MMENNNINNGPPRIFILLLLVSYFPQQFSACTGDAAKIDGPANLLPAAREEVKILPEIPHYNIHIELVHSKASYG